MLHYKLLILLHSGSRSAIREICLQLTARQEKALFYVLIILKLQVSLAICGGYAPEKSQTVNTKTAILSQNLALCVAKNSSFPSFFAVFVSVNNENRKYQNRE
jgi:hypothetical protein